MKKLIMVLWITLALVGCSSTPSEKPTTPRVYVDGNDGLELDALMQEGGLSEQYESSFTFDSGFELPQISQDQLFLNESIKVEIDSAEAAKLQKTLSDNYDQYLEVRSDAKDIILAQETPWEWSSQHLYDVYETDHLLSFTVYDSWLMYPGHAYYSLSSYAFSKETGDLLEMDDVLESLDTNLETVISYIKEDFANNPIDYYGETAMRYLDDSIKEGTEIPANTLYFRIKPDSTIAVTDSEIYLVLELYLEFNGSYSVPILYKIQRTDLPTQ